MIRLGSIVGLPAALNGRMVGRVEQAVLTHDGHALRGMVIRHGLGGARWVSAERIAILGDVSVILTDRPERLPRDASFTLSTVKDVGGLNLGRVTDAYVNRSTLQVEALEVSLGLWEELTLGRMLARQFTVQNPPGEAGQVLIPFGCVLERLH